MIRIFVHESFEKDEKRTMNPSNIAVVPLPYENTVFVRLIIISSNFVVFNLALEAKLHA